MARGRHQKKDLEELLQDAEARGWRIEQRTYFKLMCPCAEKHQTWVHLTPSNPNYVREKRSWLRAHTCWEEDV